MRALVPVVSARAGSGCLKLGSWDARFATYPVATFSKRVLRSIPQNADGDHAPALMGTFQARTQCLSSGFLGALLLQRLFLLLLIGRQASAAETIADVSTSITVKVLNRAIQEAQRHHTLKAIAELLHLAFSKAALPRCHKLLRA